MVLKLLYVQSKVSTIEGKATKAGMETIQPWLDLTKHRHLQNQPWLDLSNHRHIQNQPFSNSNKTKRSSNNWQCQKWSEKMKWWTELKTFFYQEVKTTRRIQNILLREEAITWDWLSYNVPPVLNSLENQFFQKLAFLTSLNKDSLFESMFTWCMTC